MARKASETYHWARDANRVQVLGAGEWVRVFDHKGQGHHVPARPGVIAGVLEAVAGEDPECAERIVADLEALGFEWAATLEYEPDVDEGDG